MKIATHQLRQIIREELLRIREAASPKKAADPQGHAAKMKAHTDAIAKLEKSMSAAKTPEEKARIQKRLATRKQWLSNLKTSLTKGK